MMAFIRRSGIAPLLGAMRARCDAGRELRVMTTTYTGSTEGRALDQLVELGAAVRVSYDMTTTRLHAKAWLFHRQSGFSTAYIGSSNLTHSAQVSGLEWNVRAISTQEAFALVTASHSFMSRPWPGSNGSPAPSATSASAGGEFNTRRRGPQRGRPRHLARPPPRSRRAHVVRWSSSSSSSPP